MNESLDESKKHVYLFGSDVNDAIVNLEVQTLIREASGFSSSHAPACSWLQALARPFAGIATRPNTDTKDTRDTIRCAGSQHELSQVHLALGLFLSQGCRFLLHACHFHTSRFPFLL